MQKQWFQNFIFVLGIVSIVVTANVGSALARPLANDNELELSGGFFHARGSDTGALNLDVGYGYYLTPGWQAGLRQALNMHFIDNARDVWKRLPPTTGVKRTTC
jgi:hypothetical protein